VAGERLRGGEGEVFLVGGAESMSNFPLLVGPQLVRFFQRLQKGKTALQRARALLSFRFGSLRPRLAVVEGLTDPTTGLMMGNTAENVARQFGIDRQAMDEFALQSHQRATAAQQQGRLGAEIAPFASPPRVPSMLALDDGVRSQQSLAALAELRPVFEKRTGDVTVGNSCQVTDGAAALLCMAAFKARALGLQPLAWLRGSGTAGLDPAGMGLRPRHPAPQA